MTSRRKFIEDLGGTCKNWGWSWSFVNYQKRWVAFGAWDENERGDNQMILADDWEIRNGRRANGYIQGVEHLNLVENGYALFTFRMVKGLAHPDTDKITAKIKDITPKLEQRHLNRSGSEWIALPLGIASQSYDFDEREKTFSEGAEKTKYASYYERNRYARAECLAIHGFECSVCENLMENLYGKIANKFVHVHHLMKVSDMGEDYRVNPKKDMVPVCPNCHSIIHLAEPMLTISQAREFWEARSCRT